MVFGSRWNVLGEKLDYSGLVPALAPPNPFPPKGLRSPSLHFFSLFSLILSLFLSLPSTDTGSFLRVLFCLRNRRSEERTFQKNESENEKREGNICLSPSSLHNEKIQLRGKRLSFLSNVRTSFSGQPTIAPSDLFFYRVPIPPTIFFGGNRWFLRPLPRRF